MNSRTVIERIDPGNSSDMKDFLNFPLLVYGNNAKTKNCIAKTKRLVSAGTDSAFLLAKRDGEIVGRMAVGCNEDILDQDGTPYGQIGLFEVIEDYEVFSAMVDFGRELCKAGNRYVLFPFFISTWYPYRFVSSGFDAFDFFLEPDNKEYYAQFADLYGAHETFLYKSSMDDVDDFIEKNKKSYDKAIESGFTFRGFNKSDIRNELRIAYDLSIRCFNENIFYGDISFQRFLDLYLPSVKLLDKDCFLFALDEAKKPVGFLFCSPDYTYLFNNTYMYSLPGKIRFLLERNRAKGLIAKSGAVLSEYRGKGIIGALCYLQGLHSRERNYRYIIVALAHSQNVSLRVCSSNRTEKEYKLYKIAVSLEETDGTQI
ncbi:MAG: hypothetical protein AB2L11_02705 [Syntrophobacteraceae bacterium]